MKSLETVKGVGPSLSKGLAENGLTSAEALAKASPAEIAAIPRIGPARAARLILAAQALLAAAAPEDKAADAAGDAPKKTKKSKTKAEKKADKKSKKKDKAKKAKKSDKKDGGKEKKKKKKSKKSKRA